MVWRGARSFGDAADVFTSNWPTGKWHSHVVVLGSFSSCAIPRHRGFCRCHCITGYVKSIRAISFGSLFTFTRIHLGLASEISAECSTHYNLTRKQCCLTCRVLLPARAGSYGPPAYFNWDWGSQDTPIQDDVCLDEYNVEQRVHDFVRACQELANVTRGNDVMLTMGTDFQYSNAFVWCAGTPQRRAGGGADPPALRAEHARQICSAPRVWLAVRSACPHAHPVPYQLKSLQLMRGRRAPPGLRTWTSWCTMPTWTAASTCSTPRRQPTRRPNTRTTWPGRSRPTTSSRTPTARPATGPVRRLQLSVDAAGACRERYVTGK